MDSFKINQEVINPARTEWGIGKILSVEPGPGGRGVRVRVNFPGAGVKAMIIPPGTLVSPEARPAVDPASEESSDIDRLQNLPETITDTRVDWRVRLGELIKFYRLGDDTRGIFDWAVMRTAKRDPLDAFTADELKAFFAVFCRRRDRAMKDLFRQVQTDRAEAEFQSILARSASDAVRDKILRDLESDH